MKRRKDCVVAEGEVTGHAHRLSSEKSVVFGDGPDRVIETDGDTLTHEEHDVIELPPGKYNTGIVQEWNHFEEEARRVED